MNILIVSVRGPTNANRRGGAQDYIQNVAAPWAAAGHRVEILCAQERVGGELLPAQETVAGIRVRRIGAPRSRVRPLWAAVRDCAADFDIVIENIMGFPLLLPWLLPRQVPLLAIKHHFEGRAFLRGHGWLRGGWGLLLETWIQPLAYRNTPFVTVSDKVRDEILNRIVRPRHPVEIVPPGIHPPAGDPVQPRAARPTVLYFGALDLSRKRVDHLIDAFRRIVAEVPDAELVIGGDGPDRAALEARAAGLPVRFTGFLSDADKQRWLRSAWVFASPSMSEGFGITWIEANACGLPVIVYDLGLTTVNADCAVLVPVGDLAALAAALRELLLDDARRRRMAGAAVANARRFEWAVSSARLLELILAQTVTQAREPA